MGSRFFFLLLHQWSCFAEISRKTAGSNIYIKEAVSGEEEWNMIMSLFFSPIRVREEGNTQKTQAKKEKRKGQKKKKRDESGYSSLVARTLTPTKPSTRLREEKRERQNPNWERWKKHTDFRVCRPEVFRVKPLARLIRE